MIDILLNALVPIFAVMGLGYFAGWIRDYVDNRDVAELNALVMDFALAGIALRCDGDNLPVRSCFRNGRSFCDVSRLLPAPLCGLLRHAAPPLSSTVGRRGNPSLDDRLSKQRSGRTAADRCRVAVRGNIVSVALSIAVGSIFLSPLTLGILEANKAAASGSKGAGAIVLAIGRSFRKPVVLEPIIGVIFSLCGIPLASAIVHSLQLIGQAAGGAALFVTGVILSAQSVLFSRNVISGAILKNVVHPLIGYALILVLPMSSETARAAVLLLTLPVGFLRRPVRPAIRKGYRMKLDRR